MKAGVLKYFEKKIFEKYGQQSQIPKSDKQHAHPIHV
jgi:hypothetical protein